MELQRWVPADVIFAVFKLVSYAYAHWPGSKPTMEEGQPSNWISTRLLAGAVGMQEKILAGLLSHRSVRDRYGMVLLESKTGIYIPQ